MTLPGVPGLRLLASVPAGGPLLSIPAVCERDGQRVELLLVTATLDPARLRRIRVECAELEAILADVDETVVQPLIDHGVDAEGRPYLLLGQMDARPVTEPAVAARLDAERIARAARTIADGLRALTTAGFVGAPPELGITATGGFVLATPLPPTLAGLRTASGPWLGHEPPEIIRAGRTPAVWTARARVYAYASLLAGWSALADAAAGQAPAGGHAPRIPIRLHAALRDAMAADPARRPATLDDLADALADAARPDAGNDTLVPPAAPVPVRTGVRQLGSRYLLEEEIGSGAAGTVWAARRVDDGSRVAAKLLRVVPGDRSRTAARFLREHETLTRLQHDHLLRVHDLVAEGEVRAIVMDFVPGGNLRRLVDGPRLPAGDVARLMAQTASALSAVHAAGVVHRDIKPENILVTERAGRPAALLADFGIARDIAGLVHTTSLGTAGYIAPEAPAGQEMGTPADIYALGVTACELLIGRRPDSGPPGAPGRRRSRQRPLPHPDGVDGQIWELLAACLDDRPAARPTAVEVARRWAEFTDAPELIAPVVPVTSGRPSGDEHSGYRSDADDLLGPGVSAGAGGGELETRESSRRLPVRPEESAPRRRGRGPLAATGTLVLLGLAVGVGVALLQHRASPPGSTVSPAGPQQYPVATSISAGQNSTATVTWARDAEGLPGLEGYLVLRSSDGQEYQPVTVPSLLPAGQTSFSVTVPAGGRTCFQVIAFGVTAPPPTPLPQPACIAPPTTP
ncbi:serine/threonine-protein kinase [Protofrankia coriariae]|uniref:serine/threonine-protein kinase n=1 Tax=Protofrankia coriariae TaxID=1562887 RepID=UPI0012F6F40E|nr:serine/threonine-protein kinase [Protofrankia coriariae]